MQADDIRDCTFMCACFGTSVLTSVLAPEDLPLQKSRIGTVLISAAVIDDVIGLVLSSLVLALSAVENTQSHSNLAWTVVRPMLSSTLMAAVIPIVARYILRPVFRLRSLGHHWCTPR